LHFIQKIVILEKKCLIGLKNGKKVNKIILIKT
jgi:hypothetical protein